MTTTVVGLSLLLVLIIDFFHFGQGEYFGVPELDVLMRDLLFALVLAGLAAALLDRLMLTPLRRFAASSEAFDPSLPPQEWQASSSLESVPPEVQQIRESLSRVHERLWQQLQSEQDQSAQLRAELQRARAQLEARERELGSMARVDPLTGLANRREFDEALRREFKRTQRQRGLLALAVLDLDHFKRFNARYGSDQGDEALRKIAAVLAAHFKRDTDIVARLGGEEFVALLPDLAMSEAQARLEQLRDDVRALQIAHEDGVGEERVLTLSVGLAAYTPAHPYLSPQALMQAADEALYIAKHAGRDRLSMGAS